MLKFSKTENPKNIELIKIVSLLIHAAKIDENYTEKEKDLINNFINIFSCFAMILHFAFPRA